MRIACAAALLAGLISTGSAGAKTLVFCSEGDPESLNPQVVTSMTGINAAEPMFEGLVTFEAGSGAILPGLAESWTISPDGRAYTFHLRQGVKFQSNAAFKPTRDFEAADVVFSFDRQWHATNPFHDAGKWSYDYFEDMGFPSLLEGVDRLDARTVRFRLTRAEAPFLADLAMPFAKILSAEYADAMLRAGTPARLDAEPLGTGAFQLDDYRKETSVRYRAFPDHWAGRPPVDTLVFAITPNASVRLNKLKAGECQIMSFPSPADLDKISRDPALVLLRQDGLNIGYMAMNTGHPPFDDLRVRRAVNMAIDRSTLVDAIYGKLGTVNKNPIPPTMWSYNDDVVAYPYDPAAAQALMVEAGLGGGIDLDLWYLPLTRAYNPDGRRIAEMVADDLSKIGIRARLVTAPWAEYRSNILAGDRTVAFYGWTTDNGDPDNFLGVLLGCPGGKAAANNVSKWCDPAYNALIDRAKATSDRAERERLYRQAQVIVHDQAPWVPIATGVNIGAIRANVKNFTLDPFGRFLFDKVDLADH